MTDQLDKPQQNKRSDDLIPLDLNLLDGSTRLMEIQTSVAPDGAKPRAVFEDFGLAPADEGWWQTTWRDRAGNIISVESGGLPPERAGSFELADAFCITCRTEVKVIITEDGKPRQDGFVSLCGPRQKHYLVRPVSTGEVEHVK